MIVVDTNLLVRYAVKDDRRQAIAATEFLKNNPCCILKTVLLELTWVLSSTSGYDLPRSVVAERLRHLCGLPTVTVEDAGAVAQAITWYEQGMDVAGALHLASSAVFSGFATMDKRLSNKGASLAGNHNILLIS
jgi:predicted nucleic-acid-binding protein